LAADVKLSVLYVCIMQKRNAMHAVGAASPSIRFLAFLSLFALAA